MSGTRREVTEAPKLHSSTWMPREFVNRNRRKVWWLSVQQGNSAIKNQREIYHNISIKVGLGKIENFENCLYFYQIFNLDHFPLIFVKNTWCAAAILFCRKNDFIWQIKKLGFGESPIKIQRTEKLRRIFTFNQNAMVLIYCFFFTWPSVKVTWHPIRLVISRLPYLFYDTFGIRIQ